MIRTHDDAVVDPIVLIFVYIRGFPSAESVCSLEVCFNLSCEYVPLYPFVEIREVEVWPIVVLPSGEFEALTGPYCPEQVEVMYSSRGCILKRSFTNNSAAI